MPTAQEVSTVVGEVQQTANLVLETIKIINPEAAAPAAVIEMLLELATKAVSAYAAAAGIPITPETIKALLPNPAPLSPPTV